MAFPILLLAFIFVPVVEIALLIKVGSAIGVGTTILVVIFTAILGAYLVRQQGLATLTAVKQEMNAGRVPAMQMAEGIALLFAGAVLLTPGFVTDAIGFSLLTQPIRRAVIAWFANKGMLQMQAAQTGSYTPNENTPHNPSESKVIEGEYTERE
jgi:UPF0716 protein FxsA